MEVSFSEQALSSSPKSMTFAWCHLWELFLHYLFVGCVCVCVF